MKLSSEKSVEEWLDPLKIRMLRQLQTGGVLTERRLAQYVGISHVTAHIILHHLERGHLAVSKRVGRANLWSLNRTSYGYRVMAPILSALDQVESPMKVFREILRELLPGGLIKEMILFGSLVNGTERDDSDIDLGIILNPHVRIDDPQLEKGIENVTEKCYQLFGKRFAPYVMSEASWKRKRSAPLGREIEKGKVIS